jgi:hypothetical protein
MSYVKDDKVELFVQHHFDYYTSCIILPFFRFLYKNQCLII